MDLEFSNECSELLTRKHTDIHTRILTLSHPHTHRLTPTLIHNHTCIHTHTLAFMHSHTHTRTLTPTYSYTRTITYINALIHSRPHTHIHTQKHTHTLVHTLTHIKMNRRLSEGVVREFSLSRRSNWFNFWSETPRSSKYRNRYLAPSGAEEGKTTRHDATSVFSLCGQIKENTGRSTLSPRQSLREKLYTVKLSCYLFLSTTGPCKPSGPTRRTTWGLERCTAWTHPPPHSPAVPGPGYLNDIIRSFF